MSAHPVSTHHTPRQRATSQRATSVSHVSATPRHASAHAIAPAPHFVYSCTAHATTRSLDNNGLDDTTKNSLREATSTKTGVYSSLTRQTGFKLVLDNSWFM
eukprot:scaffold118647_cov36-Phaeocystis_antarctica.AAC.1